MIDGNDADRLRDLLAARIEAHRRSASLNQREAASAVGIAQTSWANYESGTRDLPFVIALRMAKCFGLEVTMLGDPRDLYD